jgi:photosystem II stability/assembly factor-like uncharacterized protein
MHRPSYVFAVACLVFAGCLSPSPSVIAWEETGGPYAQDIAAVLPDAGAPATLYAVLTNGDFFISSNWGRSWSKVSMLGDSTLVSRILQEPDLPGRLFALTNLGAFVSPDHGARWRRLAIAEPGTGVSALVIDPFDAPLMYAGTIGKGIYKSTDGGTTWKPDNAGPDVRLETADVYDLALDPAHPNTIFGTASALGVIRSTDAGAQWHSLTENLFSYGARATRMIMGGSAAQLMYGTNAGSIVKSTDGGDSWIPSRNGLESDNVLSLVNVRDKPDLVFAGTSTGLYVSSDFGSTWGPVAGLPAGIPGRLALPSGAARHSVVAFGQGLGIRVSTDSGRSWQAVEGKLGGSTVSALVTDRNGERLLAAVGSTILLQESRTGAEWISAGSGLSGGTVVSLSSDPDRPSTFYATTGNGVFVSTDGGEIWDYATRSIRGTPRLFTIHPTIKTRAFGASEYGLFVSTDRGITWTQPKTRGVLWLINNLAFCPTDAGIIYAGTARNGVAVSSDGGFTWDASKFGLPERSVRTVALDERNPDLLYAYVSPGECYRSTNRGLEWNAYTPPWRTSDTALVAVDRITPSSAIALVKDRDLYYSPNGGGTWFLLASQNLGMHAISLYWDADTGMVYAGGKYKGVRRISVRSRIANRHEG